LNAFPFDPSLVLTMAEAVARLRAGGCLVYPTETFYGLGCRATEHEAVARVAVCKGRPEDKPLPVIAGSADHLESITPGFAHRLQHNAFETLAARFWPGPVAVLLPSRAGLPRPLHGGTGHVAARVCGHPLARQLCLEAGEPLVATSANLAGAPPVASAEALDQTVVRAAGGLADGPPHPAGGLPSTIVAIREDGALRLVREGIVPAGLLEEAGFCVL
jgi:L-threonylcarbamoyladenylate synthase